MMNTADVLAVQEVDLKPDKVAYTQNATKGSKFILWLLMVWGLIAGDWLSSMNKGDQNYNGPLKSLGLFTNLAEWAMRDRRCHLLKGEVGYFEKQS